MTSSPEPWTLDTSSGKPLSPRLTAYYNQRFRQNVFGKLVAKFAEAAERDGMTKAKLAKLTGKDPGQLNRTLSFPSNFTIDTLSELFLALGWEPEIELHSLLELPLDNFVHPLMIVPQTVETIGPATGLTVVASTGNLKVVPTNATNAQLLKTLDHKAPTWSTAPELQKDATS